MVSALRLSCLHSDSRERPSTFLVTIYYLLTKCFNLVINEDFGCLFVLTDHIYFFCSYINLKHNRLKEEKLSLELSAQRFLLSVRWTSFIIARWCPNAKSNLQMSTQTLPEIVAPKACNHSPCRLRSGEL